MNERACECSQFPPGDSEETESAIGTVRPSGYVNHGIFLEIDQSCACREITKAHLLRCFNGAIGRQPAWRHKTNRRKTILLKRSSTKAHAAQCFSFACRMKLITSTCHDSRCQACPRRGSDFVMCVAVLYDFVSTCLNFVKPVNESG